MNIFYIFKFIGQYAVAYLINSFHEWTLNRTHCYPPTGLSDFPGAAGVSWRESEWARVSLGDRDPESLKDQFLGPQEGNVWMVADVFASVPDSNYSQFQAVQME